LRCSTLESFIPVYSEGKSKELAQSIAKSERTLDLALREEVKKLNTLLDQRGDELKKLKD